MTNTLLSYNNAQGWSTQPFPSLDSEQTLILVFGEPKAIDHLQPFRELSAAYPKSHILGCSTTGAILGSSITSSGLVVAIHRFQKTQLKHLTVPISNAEHSFATGVHISQELLGPDLRGILVLSDGVQVNGSQLVAGLRHNLPPYVTVTGGLAGDGAQFDRTWVLDGANPQTQTITAIGFYGEHIRLRCGSRGSWDIFGIERRVTKAHNNVVYEIDHKPALALYKTYLGELAEGLPGTALLFPLNLQLESGQSLVRTILSVNESEQSLTFAGDVPENHMVQLMKSSPERLIDGAMLSAESAYPSCETTIPALSLAISCVGRQFLLQQRLEEEVEAVVEALPKGVPVVGFYSHGEIAPQGQGFCELHNQTMTVTAIYEA